jgi:hypothetical protein
MLLALDHIKEKKPAEKETYQLIAVGMPRGMEARILTHDNFWAKISEAIHHLHHPRLISRNNLKRRVYEDASLQMLTLKRTLLFVRQPILE